MAEKKKNRKPRRIIDWFEVKRDFISGTDTLTNVLNKHNIIFSGPNVQNHTRGWVEERKALHNKILEKIKSKFVTHNVKKWDKQIKLWLKVESVAKDLLEKKVDDKSDISAKDLANISIAIERALKGQRLIAGESTENLETKSMHLQIIELSKKIERGERIADIPEEIEEQIMENTESLQDQD